MKSYTIAGSQLAMGASLGNSAIWIHTKGDGAIERIFLNSIGDSLVGTVNVRYAGPPERAGGNQSIVMSQPAAALYIQPPMFETIVAIQSIANIRYRNATSGEAPVERFSTATTQALLAAACGDLYRGAGPIKLLLNADAHKVNFQEKRALKPCARLIAGS
jgi:hypothetical protein